ncbi:MAG: polynucleotide adenylyltransferase PcnB [Betaproteobacteria bacterium]|nr:polynucleotide adenylyltransferase PcnB [Betaproteobacteria bacterium]MDH5221014.1 polynucleotide adenylyltransferase PcnB [Betaproteobacteria bacterium]MDH5350289.1 polynucleotide adenylyltransferase PcnB [Betaproteobacteria bacterium]
MIKRFFRRVLGLPSHAPQRVGRERHPLRREALSAGALKTCEVLRQGGFSACVVGGAVRDLLLGITPKDFDVATDARPEQVKPLFRRALIIGRRFRLVHVMLGQETVEVSTFRSADAASADRDEHGRVLRDNVFGTQEEDARRRDFTINALYFDPSTEEIIDFHGGLADLRKRVLRMIGDPVTRYREDPVRMLRAVRLAAKLGLTIESATRAPIRKLAPLIERVPPARVFDEMLKLLMSGHASACVRQLREEGLSEGVLPLLDVILEQPLGERFVTLALAQTDERVLSDRPVSPAFLFAALLWHEVLAASKARQAKGERPVPALEAAMDKVLDAQFEKLALTRKLTATMREVWTMQPRFEQRGGQRPYRLLEAPRFRMGYDFLALRAASGEVSAELEAWWRTFQHADADTRKAMLLPDTGPRKKRRRRRRRQEPAGAAVPRA